MNYSDKVKGIHVVRHFPIKPGVPFGEYLIDRVKSAENPVMVVVNLIPNPGTTFYHVVKNTAKDSVNRGVVIENALKKYPQTEAFRIEGRENIVLFSSKSFEVPA